MMWLLGIAGWLRKAAQAAFGFIREKPALAAIIALCVACGWLWMGWNKADRKTAAAWAVIEEYKDANAKATSWALAEKRAKETAANDIKESANDRLTDRLASGKDASARYIASNRCLRVTPAENRVVGTDMPRPNSSPGQFERAGGVTDVAVAERDIKACTTAALRLDNAVNVWAADMIAAGLAK